MELQDSEMITLREDDNAIRHDGDDIGSLLAHDSSHAVDGPNFAPIGKVPVEVLAEIFVQSLIPSGYYQGVAHGLDPNKYRFDMHPQMIREHLGQVCQMWNTIVDNEPRLWAMFVLHDDFLDPEMVFLWINKSKSHPLDVFFWGEPEEKQDERRAILAMLHREFWRIHILYGDFSESDVSVLFPHGVSTEAPMMQTLILRGNGAYKGTNAFGGVHCPQLHSLSVLNFTGIDLFVEPMHKVHQLQLAVDYYGAPIHLYLKLLDLLPNLVVLTWHDGFQLPIQEDLRRVNLPSLRFLTLGCGTARMAKYLACLYVPPSPHLDSDLNDMFVSHFSLNESPDTFSGDENMKLRYLTLEGAIPRETEIRAILHRLKHLITLVLNSPFERHSVDALLLALSPLDQDFSSICPQLKTVELAGVSFSSSALEGFVKRRVRSDLDYPAPDLATCLALDNCQIGNELRAQFAETYGSSITFTGIPWRRRLKTHVSCPLCACSRALS